MGLENQIIGNGRYKVLKEINRGGTAVVYSGIDLTQQKKVALKVMSAKHKKEGNLRAGRFLRVSPDDHHLLGVVSSTRPTNRPYD